jgi:hypothetical protein
MGKIFGITAAGYVVACGIVFVTVLPAQTGHNHDWQPLSILIDAAFGLFMLYLWIRGRVLWLMALMGMAPVLLVIHGARDVWLIVAMMAAPMLIGPVILRVIAVTCADAILRSRTDSGPSQRPGMRPLRKSIR